MIKRILNKKTNIIILIIICLLVLTGVYFLFDYVSQDNKQNKNVSSLNLEDKELINSIAAFTVLRDDLDEDTIQKKRDEFDRQKDFFLNNTADISAFNALVKMGLIKKFIGDYKGAELVWLYAFELDPGGYIINGNLASLYFYDLKDYAKAETFYLKALSPKGIASANHYTYFSELFDLYRFGVKDNSKAEALLDRAIQELEDPIDMYLLGAEYYEEKGDSGKALEFYGRILEQDPENQYAQKAIELLNGN